MRKITLLKAVITSFLIWRGILIGIFLLVGIGVIWVGLAWSGWVIECVDCQGNGISDVSMTVDSNKKAHIAYGTSEGVKYATKDASGSWVSTLVDEVVPPYWPTGGTSIATDSNNNVHISYCGSGLKYAKKDASDSWDFISVDPLFPCEYSSLDIESNGNVHIGYSSGYATKHAIIGPDGSVLVIEELPINIVEAISIALDSNNNLHIADGASYHTNESGTWASYGLAACDGWGTNDSIAIDSNDKVHITCADGNTTHYTIESEIITDSTPIFGGCRWPSIAVDSNNNVHISIGDWGSSHVYITNKSGSWVTTIVDEEEGEWKDSSIAVDSNYNVHIVYDTGNGGGGNIKYAVLDSDNDGIPDISDNCPLTPPVRNSRTSDYYSTLQDAYDDPATIDGDTIQSQATSFTENPDIDRPISVTLKGGYDCDYNDPPTGKTILNGNMTISNGTLTIESGTLEVR